MDVTSHGSIQLSQEASERLLEIMQETDAHNARLGVSGPAIARLNVALMRDRLRRKRGVEDSEASRLERMEALVEVLSSANFGDEEKTSWWREMSAWARGQNAV